MFSYCEIMVKDFLPNIRALVAHRLKSKGFSQSQISKLLGVTQPSISYYLDKNEDYFKDKIKKIGLDGVMISRYVEMLVNDVVCGIPKSVETLHIIWRELIFSGQVCALHKEKFLELKDCDVCMKFLSPVQIGKDKEVLIESMKKSILSLESSPYFAAIIPEVNVNVAVSLNSGQGIEDIATIPGRIVRVRNRAKATTSPEFGIQGHLTKLLIAVRRLNPNIKAVINIKFDEKIKFIISSTNLAHIKTEHNAILGEDDIIESIKNSLRTQKRIPLIVFDEGGFGIEPMTYLLGNNLDEIIQVALEVARKYVAS